MRVVARFGIVVALSLPGVSRCAPPAAPANFASWSDFAAIVPATSYAECLSVFQASPLRDARSVDMLTLLNAAAAVEPSLTGGSPDARIRRAALRLVIGQPDLSVSELTEQPWQERPVEVWNDLSVAYLARATAEHSVEDAVRALDAAMRAHLLRPAFGPAAVNLRAAADLLQLDNGAIVPSAPREEASSRCRIAAKPSETPAEEARLASNHSLRLQALATATGWANNEVGGQRIQAREHLRVLRAIAERIAAATGDRFFLAVEGGCRDRDYPACLQSAEGWLAYRALVQAEEAERFGDLAHLAPIAEAKAPVGSAVRAAVHLAQASVRRIENGATPGLVELDQIAAYAERRSWLAIAGRAHWQLGVGASEAGNAGQSVAHFYRAQDLLARAGDMEGLAVVEVRTARFLAVAGESSKAWSTAANALRHANYASRYRRDAIFRSLAIMAGTAGLDGASLAFQATSLQDALAAQSAGGLSFLYADRAAQLFKMGLAEQANAALREAEAWEGRMPPSGATQMSRAIRLRTDALLNAESDTGRTLEALDRALEHYVGRGDYFAVADIQQQRVRAFAAQGRQANALQAARTGMSTLRKQRALQEHSAAVLPMPAAAWDLVRVAADLEAEDRGPRGAFQVIASLASRRGDPPKSDPPRPDTVVLSFLALDRGVYAVSHDSRGERYIKLAARRDRVLELSRRYIDAKRPLEGDEESKVSGELYQALLKPFEEALARATRVVIVPDTSLASVPFGLLREETDGSPLALTHVVIVAQQTIQSPPRHSARRPTRVMVIGGTMQDSSGLPRLPGASAELESIARLHRASWTLSGPAATKASVMAGLGESAVVHFAGHAVIVPDDPSMSRLVVAPSREDPYGAVFDTDLRSLDLTLTDVVVLASCSSAEPSARPGHAVLGLAGTLVSRGVGTVIATLWPVDDLQVSALFVDFHRHLAGGAAPEVALREAQRNAVSRHSSWRVWAAVVAVRAVPGTI